ncbi:hypothetical protein NBRC116494_18060 [Aurantivibrio plasticivorans]
MAETKDVHMFKNIIRILKMIIRKYLKAFAWVLAGTVGLMLISLAIGKIWQHWDDDPDRGAIEMTDGAFGESYQTPIYLDQGWSEADSLWFYNTTQGSALMPYDLFVSLEQPNSQTSFRSDKNIDKFRYLPQKATFFNPDALPVGFVKETYKGPVSDRKLDYIGYTCAACHTAQINYTDKNTQKTTAIRIDGGPSMANMVGFLTELEASMKATLLDDAKKKRFVDAVLALDNDYSREELVLADLKKWSDTISRYNYINRTDVDYGYARLDAFGRIFNRVLEHVINKQQLEAVLLAAIGPDKENLLTPSEVEKVVDGLDETILGSDGLAQALERAMSTDPGYPGLSLQEVEIISNELFNEADAPVSYPYLWDVPHSDYVQWNGLANNAHAGPLGRNAGEVVGVFGKLDWRATEPGLSVDYLAEIASGQTAKKKKIDFSSSIDLVNLKRLESHMISLTSPQWPTEIFGEIDEKKWAQGKQIYAQYCRSCHELVDRTDFDRLIISKMSNVDFIGTDPAMANNSVARSGNSGNFQYTVQSTDVGPVAMGETAPVALLLTAATRGVVTTPDPDKFIVRRWLDWLYTLGMSFFDNKIAYSVKNGNYNPDTTALPFNSLLSYKARPLNGIWATAPYLHNGSVPTLYDLLLPEKREGDPDEGEYRPESFQVGKREYDIERVGFVYDGYDGFTLSTDKLGNLNSGHEYGAGRTPQLDGRVLPALNEDERWALVEYLKSL